MLMVPPRIYTPQCSRTPEVLCSARSGPAIDSTLNDFHHFNAKPLSVYDVWHFSPIFSMKPTLDLNLLRTSEAPEVAAYLRRQLLLDGSSSISEQILVAVETERLPARVIPYWLSICDDPALLNVCLQQSFSKLARDAAISSFCKRLTSNDLEALWSIVGGTDGLLKLLCTFSVQHVKHFCRTFGRSSLAHDKIEPLRPRAIELFNALVDSNPDTRPLMGYYLDILQACDDAHVRKWMNHPKQSRRTKRRLLEAHPAVFQEAIIQGIKHDTNLDGFNFDYKRIFISSPPTRSKQLGLSSTMVFSMQTAQIADGLTNPFWRNQLIKDKLLLSLLRRVARRRKNSELRDVQAVAAMASNWDEHQELTDSWANNRCIVLALPYMVTLWSHWTEVLQDTFTAYLQRCRVANTEIFTRLLRSVPYSQRFQLLNLLARHGLACGVDIDDVEDLRRKELRWDTSIFLSLQHADGIALLDKMSRAHRGVEFLMHKAQFLDYRADIVDTDATLLKLLLLRNRPGSLAEATAVVDEEKEHAIRSRDQKERAEYASLAMIHAGGSGSLDLFASTLLWARRFNKDPLLLEALYGEKVFSAITIELLSGLPLEAEDKIIDLSLLADCVRKGNTIISELIDNAIAAIEEPSFRSHIWNTAIRVLGYVLEYRLCNVAKVQKMFKLSDDDMFSTVWYNTLETCISAERTLLDTSTKPSLYKPSWFRDPQSLLYLTSSKAEPNSECPTTARFLEKLAIARNDLWRQHRIELNSNVATLDEPWPKGLPIQALLPFDLKSDFPFDNIPYLMQRAKQIVFIDRSIASLPGPRDDSARSAIGSFVDSYKTALFIWVNADVDSAARDSRVLQAWKHTQAELCFAFPQSDDGEEFWLTIFVDDCGFKLPKQLRHLADSIRLQALPFHDPSQAIGWNPRGPPDMRSDENHIWSDDLRSARRLSEPTSIPQVSPPMLLDAMVAYLKCMPIDLTRKYDTHKYLIPPIRPHLSQAKLARDKESLIATALLLVSEKHLSLSSLSDPFPAADHPRFPAMSLVQPFLDATRNYDAQGTLRSLAAEVPSSLLLQLAHRLEERRSSTGVDMAHTFALASIILRSDRPQVVLELVMRLILHYPENSAWHRAILSRGLCLMLDPADVRSSLFQLAQDIRMAMDESRQNVADVVPLAGRPMGDTQARVKVTTIKMLVQLVTKAEFISTKDSLDIVKVLCTGPTHGSVRAAVIECLGSTLLEATDGATHESALATLETFVPIAAQLDEARPMDEAKWTLAEASGEPPPVWAENLRTVSPTIKKLLQVVNSLYQAEKPILRRAVFDRVLLPILLRSTENNRRWCTLYLARSGFKGDVASAVPDIPARPTYLLMLLTLCTDLIPKQYLDMLDQYIFATLHLPTEIENMNERIRADTCFPSDHAGKYWLYTRSKDEVLTITDEFFLTQRSYPSKMSFLLWSEIKESTEDGIKLADLQDFWWRYTKLFISKGSQYLPWTKQQLTILEPTSVMSEKHQRLWLTQCKPLLERTISYISGLRTAKWQHDPNRKPDILPDVEELQLWALSYPDLWSELSEEERVIGFVDETVSLLKTFVAVNRPYHLSLKKIKRALFRFPPSKYGYEIAIKLGTVDDHDQPTLVDHLRVELAGRLILKNLEDEIDVRVVATKKRLQELIETWLQSATEEFRDKGREIGKHRYFRVT
ncbi:hypothetical protein AMS68_002245 [Peltaster fructicola]|uniref:Uncharacterized protein n=1 Tax=Peltaster fructicola TaxID=286661 RepID=A0A6H0XQ17_9PEZI|nr:hypothetical protein AMS68_002245 [Peltaster fructicola]